MSKLKLSSSQSAFFRWSRKNALVRKFILKLTPLARQAVALIIASLISIFVFFIIRDVIYSRAQTQFEKDSNQVEHQVLNSVKMYSDLLYGLHSYLEANPNATYNDFNKYLLGLSPHEKFPALYAVRYVQQVDREDVGNFYQNLHDEYLQDITDRQTSLAVERAIAENRNHLTDEKEYFISKYYIPLDGQIEHIGEEIPHQGLSYQTIIESQHSHGLVSSGRIFTGKTVQGQEVQYAGFSMGTFINQFSNSEYSEKFIGNIGIGIRTDKTLFADMNTNNRYIEYQIIDNGVENNYQNTMTYDSRYQRPTIHDIWPVWLSAETEEILFNKHYEFQIGKRNFELHTFSNVIPPNMMDLKALYSITLAAFVLSFFVIYRWLALENSSEQAKELAEQMTEELRKTASTDILTGLPNRRAFMDDLNHCLSYYPEERLYLIFIDLDGFKKVNDTLGHDAGDRVLVNYAQRLVNFTQNTPLRCYRLGGDEFTIIIEARLFPTLFYKMEVERLSRQILSLTQEHFIIEKEEFALSQSMGIAEYPKHGSNSEDLFKNSDLAMYEAKHLGKNRYLFYTHEMTVKVEKKSQMENLLHAAIDKNEFYLEFQPKMCRNSNGPGFVAVGAEVLLRWNNSKLGNVSPQIFIPIAEEAGLMTKIGRWVIEQVAAHLARWKTQGYADIRLSMNISAKEFNNENLVEQYCAILAQYDISPTQIVLEITETAMMYNPERAKELLGKFQNRGFEISVDDFGTGYSSMSYLKMFMINEIKIDKSFTEDVFINERDRILVEGVIHLAHQINTRVVVEGVETQEQIDWLDAQQSVQLQGYYFSQPIAEAEFLEFWNSCILGNGPKDQHDKTELNNPFLSH
jgi:diguanylate cyclase (GGDEF)-like protein